MFSRMKEKTIHSYFSLEQEKDSRSFSKTHYESWILSHFLYGSYKKGE